MIELLDEVILLRPMTLADVPDHVAGEDDTMVRFLSGGVSTVATATRWINEMAQSWESDGPVRMFGMREANSDTLCGMIEANLDLAGLRMGAAVISYGLHARVRGRGYATRAVGMMLGYLRRETECDVAVIQVDPENPASARVATRSGFKFVGSRVTSQGEHLMTFVFGLR